MNCKPASKKKIQIFKLDACSETFIDSTSSNSYKLEVFVVANPPKDSVELLNLVNAYNDSNLAPKAEWTKFGAYYRYFFEETDSMPRDYKPKNEGYFNKEDLGNHYKDCLVKVEWNVNETDVDYPIYSFYRNGDIYSTYYPKGRKNFGNKINEWIPMDIN